MHVFYLKNCFLYIVAIPLLFLIGIFITLCKDLSLFVEGFPRLLFCIPLASLWRQYQQAQLQNTPITQVPAVK